MTQIAEWGKNEAFSFTISGTIENNAEIIHDKMILQMQLKI